MDEDGWENLVYLEINFVKEIRINIVVIFVLFIIILVLVLFLVVVLRKMEKVYCKRI